MSENKWVVEKDDYYLECHNLKFGRFEMVIHKLTDDDFDWFVNVLDDSGDILWHSLVEGVATSLPKAKKEMFEVLVDLTKCFKALSKEMK